MVHIVQDSWHRDSSIDDTINESNNIKDSIADESFSEQDFNIEKEELDLVINKTCKDKDKDLIKLIFWQGKTYRQVAEIYGVSYQAIGFRLSVILNKLRECYERQTKEN